jgi:hypothetical protein
MRYEGYWLDLMGMAMLHLNKPNEYSTRLSSPDFIR